MSRVSVKVAKVHEKAQVPAYMTEGAAGFDLYCVEDISIPPGATVLVKTGLKVAIPEGYEIQVRPRSGTSFKTKLRIANAPGTVDSDFRGELCVIVENTDVSNGLSADYERRTVKLKALDRVAQGVLSQVPRANFEVVSEEELGATDRGSGGFGSTGK